MNFNVLEEMEIFLKWDLIVIDKLYILVDLITEFDCNWYISSNARSPGGGALTSPT